MSNPFLDIKSQTEPSSNPFLEIRDSKKEKNPFKVPPKEDNSKNLFDNPLVKKAVPKVIDMGMKAMGFQEAHQPKLYIGPPDPEKEFIRPTEEQTKTFRIQREAKYAKEHPGEQDTFEAFVQGIVPYSTKGGERVEIMEKAHPFASMAGHMAGLATAMVATAPLEGVVAAQPIIRGLAIKGGSALAKVGKYTSRAIPKMIHFATAGFTKSTLDNSLKLSQGSVTVEEAAKNIAATTADLAMFALPQSFARFGIRFPAIGAEQFASAKIQGRSNTEALAQSAFMMSLGLIDRSNLSVREKQIAYRKALAKINERIVQKQGMRFDAGMEEATSILRNATTENMTIQIKQLRNDGKISINDTEIADVVGKIKDTWSKELYHAKTTGHAPRILTVEEMLGARETGYFNIKGTEAVKPKTEPIKGEPVKVKPPKTEPPKPLEKEIVKPVDIKQPAKKQVDIPVPEEIKEEVQKPSEEKKPSITTDPLIEQAKGMTLEEFVSNTGIRSTSQIPQFDDYSGQKKFDIPKGDNEIQLYHGTSVGNYSIIKKPPLEKATMDRIYGDYFYTTDKIEETTGYGNRVATFNLPKNKVLEYKEFQKLVKDKTETEIDAFVESKFEEGYWAIGMPANEFIIKDIETVRDYTKAQLTDIYNKAQGADPLIEEAKKYKSAEEFVEGQGETVLHGTGTKFDVFDDSMRGSLTGAKSAKGAIWFTDDMPTAKAYSVYSAETGVVKKALDEADALEKIAQKSGKNSDWDKYNDKLLEAEKLDTYESSLKRREESNVKEVVIKGYLYEIDAEGKSPQELSSEGDIDSWLNEQIKEAKRLGKDGLKITNLDDAVGLYNRPATHYAIFDSKNIKTKQQLTDIYNKAKEGIAPEKTKDIVKPSDSTESDYPAVRDFGKRFSELKTKEKAKIIASYALVVPMTEEEALPFAPSYSTIKIQKEMFDKMALMKGDKYASNGRWLIIGSKAKELKDKLWDQEVKSQTKQLQRAGRSLAEAKKEAVSHVEKIKKNTEELAAPDYDKVIPSQKGVKAVFKGVYGTGAKDEIHGVFEAEGEQVAFNMSHIKLIKDTFPTAEMYIHSPEKPAVFEDDKGKVAVLMPVELKEKIPSEKPVVDEALEAKEESLEETKQTDQEKKQTEEIAPSESVASESDLDFELAKSAYSWTSFNPEKRAASDLKEYVENVQDLYESLKEKAVTDEQKEILNASIEAYKQTYKAKQNAVWAASSRTASPMITGAANFPVERNRKRLATYDKRISEFLEWEKKAKTAIRKAILGSRTQEQVFSDEWDRLKAGYDRSIEIITNIDSGKEKGSSRSLFVSSVSGKIKRLAKNGEVELVKKSLDYIRTKQDGKKPIFAKNNSVWKLEGEAKAKDEGRKTGEKTIAEDNGVSIVENYDLDRTQIIFPTKPETEIMKKLKSSGWHWSPSNKAWQRKLTASATYSAQEITGITDAPKVSESITPYGESKDLTSEMESANLTEERRRSEVNKAYGGQDELEQNIEKITASLERTSVQRSDIVRKFKKIKYVDFRGNKIQSSQEIVDLFKIFRSPAVEHLHFIHLDDSGKIIAHNHVSSGDLGGVNLKIAFDSKNKETQKFKEDLQKRIFRLKTSKLIILHNHPSGDPQSSRGDAYVFNQLIKHIPQATQSVIINGGKYTTITKEEGASYDVIEKGVRYKYHGASKTEGVFNVDNQDWITERQVATPDVMAEQFKHVTKGNDNVHVAFLDVSNKAIAYEYFNKNLIEKGTLPQAIENSKNKYRAGRYIILGSKETINKIHDNTKTTFLKEPLMGIPDRYSSGLLDVIVIREDGFFSYSDAGWDFSVLPIKEHKPYSLFEPEAEYTKKKPSFKMYERIKALGQKYVTRLGEKYVQVPGALGSYNPKIDTVRTHALNSVSTTCHEYAHAIDKKYKIVDTLLTPVRFAKNGNPIYSSATLPIRKELTNLYVNYYGGGKKEHKLAKRMREGIAVLIENFIVSEETMKKEYPDLVRAFLKEGGKYYHPATNALIKDAHGILAEYNSLDSLGKVGSKVTTDMQGVAKGSYLNLWDKFVQQIVDRIAPIEKLDPEVSTWLRMNNNLNSVILQNLKGSTKRGYWALRNGEFKKVLDYNWKSLIQKIEKSRDREDFGYWLVARRQFFAFHALDELKVKAEEASKEVLELREELKAGTVMIGDKSIKQKIQELQKTIESYYSAKNVLRKDNFDRDVVSNAYMQHADRFAEESNMYDILVKEDLNSLLEEGLITTKQHTELSENEGYASFKRDIYDEILGEDTLPTGAVRVGKTKVSSMLRRAGSELTIINPLYSGLVNHAEITKKVVKQRIYNLLLNTARKHPDLFQIQPLSVAVDKQSGRILYPQEKDPNFIMARNEKGHRIPILVNHEVKAILDDILTPQNYGTFEQILLYSGRFFTKGTTAMYAPFALTNYTLDQVTATAQSRTGYIPIYSALKEVIGSLIQHDSTDAHYFMEYMVLGGERQTFAGWQDMSPDELFERIAKEKNGLKKVAQSMIDVADIAAIPSKYSEIASRAVEYIKSRKLGRTQMVALEEAGRVTAPFHHQGKWGGHMGRTWVKSIPFYNPAIQVIAQYLRAGADPKTKKNVFLVTAAMIAMSVGSMALILSKGDDDDKEQFNNLSPEELAGYIFLPHPDSKKLIRIRAPEQMSFWAALINMQIMNMLGDDALAPYTTGDFIAAGTAWIPDQFNVTDIQRFFFSWIPHLLIPAMEVGTNTRTYPHSHPLISEGLKYKEPRFQFHESNSAFSKWLGDKLDLSPKQIDHLVLGYMGRAVSPLIGKSMKNPFIKEYYFTSARNLQDYYEIREDVNGKVNSLRNRSREFSEEEQEFVIQQHQQTQMIAAMLKDYRFLSNNEIEIGSDEALSLRRNILNEIGKLRSYKKGRVDPVDEQNQLSDNPFLRIKENV